MKNTLITLIVVVFVAVGAFLWQSDDANFGSYGNDNVLDTISMTATTTSADPTNVLLLNRDTTRQYARFDNVSDTAIYLITPTSTEANIEYENKGVLTGIRLDPAAAGNSSYEFGPDNLYIGLVYATSTVAAKNINVTYR